MANEDLEARLVKLEQHLPWYERELLNFTSSIEGAESRLILRTTSWKDEFIGWSDGIGFCWN